MAKNYYEILGVQKTATADELKSAYRKLAMKYHPDRYATASEAEKKEAEEKFKEINHAYDVLSDDQKRAAYDRFGDENGPQMGAGGGFDGFSSAGGFGFDVDDLFSNLFSGFGGGMGRSSSARANAPVRGRDINVNLTITFEEAVFGAQKTVSVKRSETCSSCYGTGAKDGSSVKTCSQCKGTGRVTYTQSTLLGQMSTSTVCPTCKGKGTVVTEKCTACSGRGTVEKQRDIKVNIPAGIDNDQRITYRGEGNCGSNGGEKGSLVVGITVKPHKLYKRVGDDINIEVPISFADAALGCTLTVPSLYGNKEVKVPDGTQSGTVFRVKNCGVKKLRANDNGDMFVKVIVEVPRSVTREQKDMLKRFGDSFEARQYPLKRAYEDKLK